VRNKDQSQLVRSLRAENARLKARLRRTAAADDALGESEARIRAILNTMVDAVITIDPRGIIQSFNPAAERMFGYKASAVMGKSVNMLMPEPYRHNHDKYVRNYLKTGDAKIIGIGREVVGLRKDGTIFPMDLAVSEVRLGKRILFTGIVRDITERKKAQEVVTSISETERRQFGQELHDNLGQQLTGISLLTKSLEKRMTGVKKELRKEAADISELVNKALEDAKLQAHGLYPIELERHGLCSALVELAYIQERIYRVSCIYDGPEELPELERREALHLYRIAQEAVNNALKHGHAREIRIVVRRNEELFRLVIEDNGSGLPEGADKKGGMGISIMRYRAAELGAKMEFRRGDRGGTVVSCIWYMPERVRGKQTSQARTTKHGSKR
jgi:two-component system sensor kinase FixL